MAMVSKKNKNRRGVMRRDFYRASLLLAGLVASLYRHYRDVKQDYDDNPEMTSWYGGEPTACDYQYAYNQWLYACEGYREMVQAYSLLFQKGGKNK